MKKKNSPTSHQFGGEAPTLEDQNTWNTLNIKEQCLVMKDYKDFITDPFTRDPVEGEYYNVKSKESRDLKNITTPSARRWVLGQIKLKEAKKTFFVESYGYGNGLLSATFDKLGNLMEAAWHAAKAVALAGPEAILTPGVIYPKHLGRQTVSDQDLEVEN